MSQRCVSPPKPATRGPRAGVNLEECREGVGEGWGERSHCAVCMSEGVEVEGGEEGGEIYLRTHANASGPAHLRRKKRRCGMGGIWCKKSMKATREAR